MDLTEKGGVKITIKALRGFGGGAPEKIFKGFRGCFQKNKNLTEKGGVKTCLTISRYLTVFGSKGDFLG